MPCGGWTIQEIERMKHAFLRGDSMKIIARHLGRSPTAINKALSRFGIRPKKHAFLSYKIPNVSAFHQINKIIKYSKTPSASKIFGLFSFPKEDGMWVSINDVVGWLHKHYIPVRAAHQKPVIQPSSYYIGKRPFTPLQLVLLANRLRIEKKKAIFMVNGVTW